MVYLINKEFLFSFRFKQQSAKVFFLNTVIENIFSFRLIFTSEKPSS